MNITKHNIILPKTVKYIISSLESYGFEAFVVGGAIRDSLLGQIPKDYDIATNATPENIVKIFGDKGHKTLDVGKNFGTIIVNIEQNNYEITTYRIEKDYLDNRRPSTVYFTKQIYEDLRRRDLTINAMAYNVKTGVLDFFNGTMDLSNNIIRTVGEPSERFNEDALRMLRAIRFSSKLNFKMDKNVENSILKNKSLIRNISYERINVEINKILSSKNPCMGIRELISTELIYEILDVPDKSIDKSKHLEYLNILDEVYTKLCCEGIGRLCFFYFFLLKYILEEKTPIKSSQILKLLKYDKLTITAINSIITALYYIPDINNLIEMKDFINRIKQNNICPYINILSLYSEEIGDMGLRIKANNIKNYYKIIEENKIPINIKDLAINGKDLIVLGFKQGKIIKDILEYLLDFTIENPSLNNKEILIKLVKERFNS
ncbi:CCA tRNA nucleotidyltransferase [Hathewaya massiliensis]|uniref:CCA tRNA nucleotidyltransferase n=1 Tax=Hathewaya massiliensis TaxID=1964382 RepID=UPI001158EB52|nr:CCA tRNA nucleotidyltransferase [Hathewaya massiliensis]